MIIGNSTAQLHVTVFHRLWCWEITNPNSHRCVNIKELFAKIQQSKILTYPELASVMAMPAIASSNALMMGLYKVSEFGGIPIYSPPFLRRENRMPRIFLHKGLIESNTGGT